jgi:hypothetical protein
MNDSRGTGQPDAAGLCPRCANVKLITSAKGSTFLLCQLSATDPRFPRYPPQPVVACGGFTPATAMLR